MTDDQIREALTEPQVLALTLYGEARSEQLEGRVAVGCVIRNRVESGRWGSSYREVCLKKWQFSCWIPEGGLANYEIVMSAARMLLRKDRVVPVLGECLWIADGLMAGVLLDRVKGANHYYAPKAMKPAGRVPGWAKGKTPHVTVGEHRFFTL